MTDLVRQKLSQTTQVKSLQDLVRAKTSETALLLIDVSGSMNATMRNGKKRVEGLRDVVKDISGQATVKMIAFGGSEDETPRRVSSVPHPGGGTPLAQAINLARRDGAGRAIVISDGVPDSQPAALEAAREFGGRIDVVFVGNPGEYGEEFLRKLAEMTGGTEFHGDLSQPKELSSRITGLLSAGDDDDE